MLRVLSAAALLAAPAAAQDRLTPGEFLDRAEGRTLTFSQAQTGTLVGVEQFLRRDLSVWATADGRCTYGRIEVREDLVCFIYEDNPDPDNCWTPFDMEGKIVVLSVTGDIQEVTNVSRTPVACRDAPVS